MRPITYKIIVITILSILLFGLGRIFDWQLRWYHWLIVFSIGLVIGKFLFVFYSGVMVEKVIILETEENDPTAFIAKIQFGLSDDYFVIGGFNKRLSISDDEMADLLYNKTPKKKMKKLIDDRMKVEHSYSVNGDDVTIEFERTGEFQWTMFGGS